MRRDRSESVPRDIDPFAGPTSDVPLACIARALLSAPTSFASGEEVIVPYSLHRSLASDVRPPQRRNDSERRSRVLLPLRARVKIVIRECARSLVSFGSLRSPLARA